MVGIRYLYNETAGQGLEFQLRPSYYDALDGGASHIPHSELTMGRLRFSLFSDDLKIRDLSIVNVESVNNSLTGLPGDSDRPWKIGLGLEQLSLDCEDCLTGYFRASTGYSSLHMGRKLYLGAYLGVGLADNTGGRGIVYVNPIFELGLNLNQKWRLKLKSQYRDYVESNNADDLISEVLIRRAITHDLDLRIDYKHDTVSEYGISTHYYW